MKTKFKHWLIDQNSEFINSCGVDCILSKLDDELNILPCYDLNAAHKEEVETLGLWLDAFYRDLDTLSLR